MIAKFESAFTPCVEIGWRFKKSFWGNGFATEAAQACLEFGFSTLGFTTVHSLTSVHIKKSKAVLQSIGMKKLKTSIPPKSQKTIRFVYIYILQLKNH